MVIDHFFDKDKNDMHNIIELSPCLRENYQQSFTMA
jgi:hypothetical protein